MLYSCTHPHMTTVGVKGIILKTIFCKMCLQCVHAVFGLLKVLNLIIASAVPKRHITTGQDCSSYTSVANSFCFKHATLPELFCKMSVRVRVFYKRLVKILKSKSLLTS